MGDVVTLVSGIEYKVRRLTEKHAQLKEENVSLTSEIQKLKRSNDEQKQIINQLEEKIRVLKLTKALETKGGDVDSKLRINEMLREIEKCIGLLNA
jgi:ATP-dependent protease ClpP protease subunit